ncbi:MAG: tRNA-binding protein [Phycisphaerales bacterium JB040]
MTGGAGASIDDLARLDIRVARVTEATLRTETHVPAYALTLDCGPEMGIRRSSAQLTDLYSPESLVGKLVLAVVNLPSRRVAGLKSECLVLGVYNSGGTGAATGPVTLVTPDGAGEVRPGDRLG